MSQKLLFTLLICALTFGAASAWAQDQEAEEKTFDLQHGQKVEDEYEIEDEGPAYEPILEEDRFEFSFTLGYMGLGSQTLFQQDRIIYKYTDEFTYYGDVEITGASAFNPSLYLNYNFSPWLVLEPTVGISFSEYTATVGNRFGISNTPDDDTIITDPELGEFDAENRSCITMNAGINALFYPADYGNFGRGRFHPFLLGGIHRSWYSLNSDYTDSMSDNWTYVAGAGFRLIADDLISIRFQVTYNRTDVEFDPDDNFVTLDEGTLPVPVTSHSQENGVQSITEFDSHTVSAISWGLGVTANF